MIRSQAPAIWTTALERPGLAIDFPKTRIKNIRVRRIDDQIASARFVAATQNFFPRLATIFRTEHAALIIRSPNVTQRRNVNEIGIAWMNAHARDLSRVFETDALPGLARVRRLIHSIAVRHVTADRRLAHTDANNNLSRI